nr:cobalt ABC transporter permease [Aliiroseovarius sp. xm-g-7]
MIRAFFLTALLALPVLPAYAHNVISAVFPSGSNIEGEVGFSNGDMAADLLIEVFDEAGTKIGETTTDADGFFLFTPAQPVTHVFRGDLGAGHVAEVIMPGAEVAELMGQSPTAANPAANPAAAASVLQGAPGQMMASTAGLSDQAQSELATMLRTELRPLRKEITALKNEANFQSILGGIGYIFGLFGVVFYIAARRKMGDKMGDRQ